ncbi:unnamed protein product, partial [Mesorhabditis belari]|uniref:C3H1-type domain-containing protein n=1 Tax=Mesorhabditis belari TaxID=2138241 RepID=A0AAF3FK46_9BILA
MSHLDQTVTNAPFPVRTSSPLPSMSNNSGQHVPAVPVRDDGARRFSMPFNVQGQYVDQHGYGYGQVAVAPQYGPSMHLSSNVQLVTNNSHLAYQHGMMLAYPQYYGHPGNDVQAADAAAVRRVSSAPNVHGQYVDQLGHGHGQGQVNVGAQYGQASLGTTTPPTNVPQHDAHLACPQRGMIYAPYPNYGGYPSTDDQADENAVSMRRYSTPGVQGQYWDQFGYGYGQVNVGVSYGQAMIQGPLCESTPPSLQQLPHNAHLAYQQSGMLCAYPNYYSQPSYDDRANEATMRLGALKLNGDGQRPGAGNAFRGTPPGYSNHKTRLCKTFQSTGSCPHGERCRFAHGERELQSAVLLTGENEKHQMRNTKFEPNHQRRIEAIRGNSPTSYANYKTRMCSAFSTKGYCLHGDNCRYAHAETELRSATPVTSNGRYKTKLCKHFESNGIGKCNYGSRCEFIHPSDGEYRKSVTPKKEQRNSIQHLCRKGSVDGPSLNK